VYLVPAEKVLVQPRSTFNFNTKSSNEHSCLRRQSHSQHQRKKVPGSQSFLFLVSHVLIDAIVHSRILNDEKTLKKVVKRFHTYASVAFPLLPTTPSTSTSAIEDARDNFLIELASFQLSLKKAVLVCEAEARQVEEYEKERQNIGVAAS
jgi:hypothetical protein